MTLGREGGRRNPEYVLLLNPLDQRIRDLSIRLSHCLVSTVGAHNGKPEEIREESGEGAEIQARRDGMML